MTTKTKKNVQLAHSGPRSRFLDRLAKVLARDKGKPEEVASAYMIEVEDNEFGQQVEIRVAKDEGLLESDTDYLRELGVDLERVVRGDKSASS